MKKLSIVFFSLLVGVPYYGYAMETTSELYESVPDISKEGKYITELRNYSGRPVFILVTSNYGKNIGVSQESYALYGEELSLGDGILVSHSTSCRPYRTALPREGSPEVKELVGETRWYPEYKSANRVLVVVGEDKYAVVTPLSLEKLSQRNKLRVDHEGVVTIES